MTLVDLHLRKGLPPQKKYNGAQRIAYTCGDPDGAGVAGDGAFHLQADAGALGYDAAGWVRDGAVGALLADDGLLRVFSGACGAGDSGRVEQLSLDGERV